jgi:hypothetical protein
VTYPSENGKNDLIVMGDLPRKWWRFHGMEDRARKRTILIDGRGLKNALEDEGKIGLESALF